jgi:hypothetical protein
MERPRGQLHCHRRRRPVGEHEQTFDRNPGHGGGIAVEQFGRRRIGERDAPVEPDGDDGIRD